MDKVQQMLAVVQSYARDADSQALCTEIVSGMRQDGMSEDQIVEALAGLLVDGLRHGNWPWTGKEETR